MPILPRAVFPPSNGSDLVFLPGSTARINWTFDDDISTVRFRDWSFTSTDGSFKGLALASISRDGGIIIETALLEVAVEKPATLVLKNVNNSYDGKYKFLLFATSSLASEVVVIIVVTPNITFSCSNPSTVNEGANFTCLCKAEHGGPTDDVTWYDKNDVKIGETGKGEKLLTLINVNATHSGIYTCKAQRQSHINATDEKSIEVKVRLNYKPRDTNITFTPKEAAVGRSVTITCESDGLPEPSYAIFHNGSHIDNRRTHVIENVSYTHKGTYKCVATNKLGSDSAFANLTVVGAQLTTQQMKSSYSKPIASSTSMETIRIVVSTTCSLTCKPPTTTSASPTRNKRGNNSEKCSSGTEWYIVVVTLVSGILVGIILSYVVFRVRRRRGKPQQSKTKSPTAQVDSTYQELDLKKMNREDNYQSLKGNAARNDAASNDESNYAELNKTRDVENNYQSLT
ncbi:opioid-binding protein/cell adhesion molecule-like isoform X2 [Dendronephthya gigantea]|uniref:opioid-binding protein/cell adhesion molecule-like isoform X2 n=1 Tax=Dendronephthya gigantea TaxID=151771 RepID=UPI00106B7CF9|nr:opioid-binding protein/cell adhesion molecule-like isoform X2 [Dendronephthya gigantea]